MAMAPIFLVNTIEASSQALLRLQGAPRLAVDCEGVDLSRRGRLCLVQVADPRDGTVHIFDVVALGGLPQFLVAILGDPRVLKIFHDCRQDSDALYHQCGVALANVLDTQLCDALHQQLRTGRLPPFVSGLKKLLELHVPHLVPPDAAQLKASVSAGFDADLRLWERRPLPQHLLLYAAYDVALLGALADHLTAGFHPLHLEAARRASARYVALFRDAPEANDRQTPGGRGRENARLDPALFA
eukprot:tig00022080_g23787.t1